MNSSYQKISEIKSAAEGERKRFRARFILKALHVKTAKNGSEYFLADFSDNTGSISVPVFADSLAYIALAGAKAGEGFFAEGVSDFYNGRLSPKIDALTKMTDAELAENLPNLVESSPFDAAEMKAELFEIIDMIPNAKVRETVLYALNDAGDAFFTSTAAIKMHHAYAHGLLEHSLKLAKLAVRLLPIYDFVNPSLALAGAVLHDIGKVLEYSQGLSAEKTRLGVLQGHVVLGFRIVRKAALKCKLDANLAERLEHIILSHQGELEWGAAALAATPEAVFVSMLDYLDARMGAVYGALRGASGGAEFSELVPALQARILLSPLEKESFNPNPPDFTVCIASSNANKIKELRDMFASENLNAKVLGADELGGMPECDENSDAFSGNALVKAEALKGIAPEGAYILADDSGIVVDALGGRPGVRSARYAGVGGEGSDKANNAKLLKELEGVPAEKRTARFVCALALICPNGEKKLFEGKVEGRINFGEKGENGFGYDPLFELPSGLTTAEL
ncbi:MAG: HD domain-containing protein, partial [Opitutales bacterium]|nr:HD domain-containing protein [Opitutales bacterium]